MFKFIHAADLHLDSPLRGLERYEGAPVEEIRGASRRAMENLVALAIEEEVSFVVICGDLYDGDLRDFGACRFLHEQMLHLRDAKIPVYTIQGNHDAENRMTRHLRLPENVHILPTDEVGSEDVLELGVRIIGRGFKERSVTENLAAGYPSASSNAFHIGLLHTSVDGREGHDNYAPCSLDDLRAKEYGYWALGHIHRREILCADPPIVFPGNLQGRHIRESGAKGCELVRVENGRVVHQESRELDVMRWSVCHVDASGAEVEDDLRERIRKALELQCQANSGRLIALRVEIDGSCQVHNLLADRPETWINQIRAEARDVGDGRLWVEKVRLRTTPEIEVDSENPAIRAVLDYLEELRTDEAQLSVFGNELADLKKKLPRELTEGPGALDLDSPARLRVVLDQIGSSLVRGLLSEGSGP